MQEYAANNLLIKFRPGFPKLPKIASMQMDNVGLAKYARYEDKYELPCCTSEGSEVDMPHIMGAQQPTLDSLKHAEEVPERPKSRAASRRNEAHADTIRASSRQLFAQAIHHTVNATLAART
jgi:hypothetical protein